MRMRALPRSAAGDECRLAQCDRRDLKAQRADGPATHRRGSRTAAAASARQCATRATSEAMGGDADRQSVGHVATTSSFTAATRHCFAGVEPAARLYSRTALPQVMRSWPPAPSPNVVDWRRDLGGQPWAVRSRPSMNGVGQQWALQVKSRGRPRRRGVSSDPGATGPGCRQREVGRHGALAREFAAWCCGWHQLVLQAWRDRPARRTTAYPHRQARR